MSIKDFEIIDKLGQGSFSTVYKVKRIIDSNIYAMKKIKLPNLNQKERQNALNQVKMLSLISHPNIIGYKQCFLDSLSNYLYLIMQYADNGDLYSQILKHSQQNTRFSQQNVLSIVVQVTRGLKVLHDMNILHRDVKSANIFMFKNGAIKLGDLNASKVINGLCNTQRGTPYYSSPEVWKNQGYNLKSDMWSLGCAFYEAMALKVPFSGKDMDTLYKKVIRGLYSKIPEQYSNGLKTIIKMLLQVTPHLRWSCDKILQQPLVTKNCTQDSFHLSQNYASISQPVLQTSQKKDIFNLPQPRYYNTIKPLLPNIPQRQLNRRQSKSLQINDEKEYQPVSVPHKQYFKTKQNLATESQLNVIEQNRLPEIYQNNKKTFASMYNILLQNRRQVKYLGFQKIMKNII